MSGGGIKVGSGGLEALIDDMVKGVNGLKSIVTDMDRDLTGKTAGWEAGSKDAWADVKKKWNGQVEDLNEMLLDIKNAVQSSKEAYLAGELKNKNSW